MIINHNQFEPILGVIEKMCTPIAVGMETKEINYPEGPWCEKITNPLGIFMQYLIDAN